MKPARIAWAAIILIAIGFEIYAVFDPNVWTLSRYFWSEGPDKFMVGAPLIAVLGFICGHLVWPQKKTTSKPKLRMVLILAWIAYEVAAWAFMPSLQWTTSRMVFRWFSWMGIPGVDVFAVHFFAGHLLWTRGLVKNE